MAATALVSVAGGTISSVTGPLAAQQFGLDRAFKRELGQPESTVSAIEAALEDAKRGLEENRDGDRERLAENGRGRQYRGGGVDNAEEKGMLDPGNLHLPAASEAKIEDWWKESLVREGVHNAGAEGIPDPCNLHLPAASEEEIDDPKKDTGATEERRIFPSACS